MTIDPVRCVYPNVRPKDASTLILLDRSGATPKVLVGRRHAGHEFMPSKFVFPGGRVEIGDRRVPVAGELDPEDEARLMSDGAAEPGQGARLCDRGGPRSLRGDRSAHRQKARG